MAETATREKTTATVTVALDDRQAKAWSESGDKTGELYGLPMRASRRDQVYDLLRAAGEDGITLAELSAAVPCPQVHVESLRFEGHVIDARTGMGLGAEGRWGRRVMLLKDAWA